MPSLASSISSLFEGIGNIISGLIESVFAVFASIFHALQQVLLAIVHTFEGLVSTVLKITGDLLKIVTGESVVGAGSDHGRRVYADPSLLHISLSYDSENIIPVALIGGAVLLVLVLTGNRSSVSSTKKKA
jgi:hypothetical protein